MQIREPFTITCDNSLDSALEEAYPKAAVFLVWPSEGEPYLGKTGVLRRRLKRLLRQRESASRILNLRDLARRIEYWPVASRLESAQVLYTQAKLHLPDRYLAFLKLRLPPYLKLILENEFPRTQISTRFGSGDAVYYGPFRSKATAELFEHEFLNLFQLRRCQEDLFPSPDHAGCIYGEMGMCLRPCQQTVSVSGYASEVNRVADFLRTDGRHFKQSAEAARERLSTELDFEAAARQHKRVEQIEQVLKLRDELVTAVEHLHGIAITPSMDSGCVDLRFVHAGAWQHTHTFFVALSDQSVSMDRRLKDLFATLTSLAPSFRDRQEHLAILAKWYYSSWRDGEWIGYESADRISYRRIVGAISRVYDSSRQSET